jgi:hypothetical protein
MSDQLVGTWQLRSWIVRDDHGNVIRPFGDHPAGVVVITADGWFTTQVATSSRPLSPTASNPFGDLAERSAALFTYIAYAGRYRVEGNVVTTTIAVGVWPGTVGTDLVREFEVHGDVLVLRFAPMTDLVGAGRSDQQSPSGEDERGARPAERDPAVAPARALRMNNELVWHRAA